MSNDEASCPNDERDEAINMPMPRSRFSAEEDAKLVRLQQQQLNWNEISRQIGNRSPRQCRERFQNYLDPELNKSTWTPDEDNLLLMKESEMGKKWKKMMPYFQNRSNVNIKNRFTTLQNRIKANERQQKEVNADHSASLINAMPMKKEQIQKMMNWQAQSQQFQQMKQIQSMRRNQLNEAQMTLYRQSQMSNQMMMPMTPCCSNQSSYFTDYSPNSLMSLQQMQINQQAQYESELLRQQQMQSLNNHTEEIQNNVNSNEEIKVNIKDIQNQSENLDADSNDQDQKENQMQKMDEQFFNSNIDKNGNEDEQIVDDVFDDDQEIRMMWNFIDSDIGQKNNFF